jgi:hypothetical protein
VRPGQCRPELRLVGAGGRLDTIAASGAEHTLKYRSLWLSTEEVARIGWQVGPEQTFLEFGARTPTYYSVEVLVQRVPGTDSVVGYLYAFHGG